jgi:glucose/arabinose dehydrogenase
MIRPRAALTAAMLLLLFAAVSASGQSQIHRAADHHFRVVTAVDGLEIPWSMTWLPNGDMLVTERPGRLRIVRDGALVAEPVSGVPEVFAQGQGGLLDVALHPDFAANRLVYLSYSKPVGDNSATAVSRGRLEDGALLDVEEIFVAQASGRSHYGSRIVFDADGYMFVSMGDRQVPSTGDLEAHPAQDLSNHHGVIVRLHDDGSVPEDNPFVGQAGALPEIWSYGHRNQQGLAIDPVSGTLYASEHGPQGGDEVNVIERGGNYGWPVVGYGVNYRSGTTIHEGTMREGMVHPAFVWVPSIGTSGLMVYTGDKFPRWQGDLFAGGLSGEKVSRLIVEDGEIVEQATLLRGIGRVRDVRQGPDGYIYVAIENRDGSPTPIVRLEPVDES